MTKLGEQCRRLKAVVTAFAALGLSINVEAVPPPAGVAPVLVPAGGFGINGYLFANTPTSGVGSWSPGVVGSGGAVLDAHGVPLNPTTTFHFLDPYNSSTDNSFVGGLKWTDDPNTWSWSLGKPNSKTDINNVLLHIAFDANGHTWVIVAADRFSTSGDSYIDFEFLQNPLVANSNGTFTSGGPNGGRTTNDLLLSLAFTGGGSMADFFAYTWTTNSGGFAYVDSTAALPVGKVFVSANTTMVPVPFGAFGSTNYNAMAFADAAVDMTALLGNIDQCLSIGFKTIMVKTKTSAASTATISDFIDPIQYSLKLGPSANAGPNQTLCSQGPSTSFALQGTATPGLFPISSTTWSVVGGSATIDATNSLATTAHVTSGTATLRLTVVQANGCTEASDVVLTVSPLPAASIAGSAVVCPTSSSVFLAPSNMTAYSWTVSGDGTISGPTNQQAVTVLAGATCGANFTLSLTLASNGCPNTWSTNVLVNNTTAPSIIVPPNLVLQCPADTSTNNIGTATATDVCGAVSVSFSDSVTNGCGGTETISRMWTAVDLCGNTSSAVQTISVVDTTPPTITAPANLVLECPANTSTNVTGVAMAHDGCSAVTINFSDSVSNTCGGATRIISRTWTATDACGNAASALQIITVRDTTPPTITAPASLVLECPANTSTNFTGVALASDGCSAVTITYSDAVTNSCGATKTIFRTWVAADACGNRATALQTITVRDTTPPTVTAPADLVLQCPANTATNATGVAIASDGCSAVTLAYSDSVSNTCGGAKIISRIWTATDACGNTANALQTIMVQDTTPPTLTIPANLVLQCPANTATNATGTAAAQDGCSAAVISYSDIVSNTCGGAHIIFRNWTAADGCGNSTNAIQTITVEDTTPPTIIAPTNLVLECPANTSTNVTGVAIATDGCSAVTINYSDVVSNTCSGATHVIFRTWIATDGCGNAASALQTITVRDTTPPTITAPPNMVLECPANTSTNATGVATAHDGCSAVTINYSDIVTNLCGGTKMISRTWIATDACGNSATALQTITVRDTTPPTVIAPASLVLQCPANTATNATGVAIAQDGCSAVALAYSDSVSNTCGGAKIISRTWTATDACGNTASAMQTITVQDTTPPTLTVPANLVLQCPANTATNATGTATAQDTCSAAVISYSDSVSNTCGGAHIIFRTWTASDGCGNSTNAVQTITVQDTTAPTLTVPANVVLECPNTDTSTNYTGVATATDTCSAATVTYSDVVSNPCGGAHIISRTWTAIDGCGNSVSRVQTITVRDTTPPTLTVPPSVVLQCPAITTTNVTGVATAQDTCSSVTVSYSDSVSNICGAAKVITRTWTATDGCGNSTNAVQLITVQDLQRPVLLVPIDVTLECGSSTAPGATGTATATDICSSVTVTYSDSVSNICGGSKVITRTWTAADGCGNSVSAPQVITVLDRIPPSIALTYPPPCSSSQGGWGGGGQFAQILASNYLKVFTNGLILGVYDPTNGNAAPNGLYWQANSAGLAALQSAVSQGGGSGAAITQDALNPSSTYGAGGLGRQTLSLTLNVGFNAAGLMGASNVFPTLVYTNSGDALNGLNVSQILALANQALAGLPLPSGYNFSSLSSIMDNLNVSFENCSASSWAASHLVAPSLLVVQCPNQIPPPDPSTIAASDTCSGPVTVSNLPDFVSSYVCPTHYTIQRTWVATDPCGNSNSISMFYEVLATNSPALTCPANLTLNCPADTTTNNTGVATAQGTCGPVTVSYSDVVSNLCGGTKIIFRTWIADSCTSTSAVQTITVQDITPPTITAPANLVLQCPANTTTNATGVATAQDGCSAVSIAYSDTVSNTCGNVGTISRTWTATDGCGNTASAVQTITVQDTTPPTITAPPNLVLQCPANTATNVTGVATALDGCSAVTISYSDKLSNPCGNAGTISRTWTATDACGNTASAVQTITVQDTAPPTLTVGTNRTVTANQSWSFDQPTATDTCSTPTINVLSTVTNLTATNLVVTRTWSATDACGNSVTGAQTITVITMTGPTIVSSPRSQTVALGGSTTLNVTAGGSNPFSYRWQFNGANIAGATNSSLSLTALKFADAGSYTVTVANAVGTATSRAATINITPTLTIQPAASIAPGFNVALPGGSLVVTWAGSFVLQSAPAANGPYTDVVGATSPYMVNPTLAPQMFFRLQPGFSLAMNGVKNGQAALTVAGSPGLNFIVQASTDLKSWSNLATNSAPGNFIDTKAGQYPMRFYRVALMPAIEQHTGRITGTTSQ